VKAANLKVESASTGSTFFNFLYNYTMINLRKANVVDKWCFLFEQVVMRRREPHRYAMNRRYNFFPYLEERMLACGRTIYVSTRTSRTIHRGKRKFFPTMRGQL